MVKILKNIKQGTKTIIFDLVFFLVVIQLGLYL